jgi:hypothetical protein
VLGGRKVLLRAERGAGNGRVYEVHFSASDGVHACTGSVRVGVPRNMHGRAVDDGQIHDATHP